MQRIVFVVTKPLQLLVAMAIRDMLKDKVEYHLILLDMFACARDVSLWAKKRDGKWNRITLIKDRADLFSMLSHEYMNEIFIDSDVGFRQHVRLFRLQKKLPKLRISVYEEGIGTYRKDLYGPIKRRFFQMLNIGWAFGASQFTDCIYVFNTENYVQQVGKYLKTNKAKQITPSLQDYLTINGGLLNSIFNCEAMFEKIRKLYPGDQSQSTCVVYFSNWIWDSSLIQRIKRKSGFLILKAHPHLKIHPVEEVDCMVDSHIPGELLLLELHKIFEKIIVYHHGTSIERYIKLPGLIYRRV